MPRGFKKSLLGAPAISDSEKKTEKEIWIPGIHIGQTIGKESIGFLKGNNTDSGTKGKQGTIQNLGTLGNTSREQ